MRRLTLFLLDISLLYASLLAMLGIRYDEIFYLQLRLHLLPFGIIFALWLLVFYIANLYDRHTFRNTPYFYSNLVRTIVAAGLISTSFFYLIPIFGITPKTNLFIFIALFAIFDTLGRSLFNHATTQSFKRITLIVGNTSVAHETAEFINVNPQLGYKLAAIIQPDDIRGLKNSIREKHVHTIVISPEGYKMPELIDTFYQALSKRITFYDLSTFYERLTGRVPLGTIDQLWFLQNLTEDNKRGYEVAKRAGDIVFGLVFGAISALLYPFISLGIALTSPGPVFYTQIRQGHLGRPFKIIKFRTMVANAEASTGAVWASTDDTRVTPFGRFLRRTRLDELPQFWTVIAGHISLVGPRAERPEFHELLKKEVPFYEERYLIKPGLTGWAQINYPYGSSVADAAEKLKYDLYYIKNRSFALDVGIILKTLRTALSQAGN
ncbi:MAG: hypothetical protein A3I39_03085 [Candidatus Yanofskybacteria bacterium RIFCSPLOWO2_02_FULL_47_9b]|uniref:Bacterial sugar transferase domain-containing protein n=1 Tax=Candidatus Yanofskybacteria bacterium RIFCSPLOWO2_02_FULL_47_9b TaxID=1802708 RepID=A0A1F8H6V4_9BACT|nr:MAG: hypothetical protein A3I39_03085 [Candidatus Yanofskybacteria bacterium RIFCSPLOWO2_02_FULL_47_9b]